MRKLFYSLMILASLLAPLALVADAAAVDVFPACGGKAKTTDVCGDVNTQNAKGGDPITTALKSALNIVSLIAGAAAIIMVIVSGFRFITSNGDANGIKSARDSLLYSLLGVIILLSAQSIVVFALNKIN